MTLLIIILGIFAILILYRFAKIAKALLCLIISLFFLIIKVCSGGRFRNNNLSNTPQINHLTDKAPSHINHSTFAEYKHKQRNACYENKAVNKNTPNQIIEPAPKTMKNDKPSGPLKYICELFGAIIDLFGTVFEILG